ncbi:unnamed protein product [Vicia faba]|uniref:Uncharacterized protein n=1 Tax=Vicia faba TaxID=3906 RepID=A0AAV0Z8J7_VICFA|nr:unnamed protein product [Vicia faba]
MVWGIRWTRDDEDEPVDVQAPSTPVQDDVHMVVEADFLHLVDVPYPSDVEATTTIEITLETIIDAHTSHTDVEVPPTDDVEVTTPVETYVTTHTSTDPFVHINRRFPGKNILLTKSNLEKKYET